MRRGRRVPVILASALAVTLVGGVAAAVAGQPTSAKACVAANGGLRLPANNGKCASGQSAISLGGQGPVGPRGAKGKKGARGAQGLQGQQGVAGPAGPAAQGKRINFAQITPEASSDSHYLASGGPISVIASCQGTSGTTSKLVLSVFGGTEALTYTATDTSTDSGGPAVETIAHGTSAALATTAVETDTTSLTQSDLLSLVVGAADGTQLTGTLDAELSVTASPSSPACTVSGTLDAA